MVKQRTQFTHRDGDIRFHRVSAEEIIEDAAHWGFLERSTAHVTRSTEGVFTFFNVVEQCFGQRRQNFVDVCVGALTDFLCDILSCAQCIFEELNVQTQIVQANIQSRVGVGERINRQMFVHRADFFAQVEIVSIPVEDNAAQTCVVVDEFQQVFTVVWINNLKIECFQCLVQFTDRLFFEVDAHVIQDGNNIHTLILQAKSWPLSTFQ